MINAKMLGMLVAAFVAGSFVASPELRAYAANTVFSTDIVDGQVMTVDLASNSVTAAKIKDSEVKAAEIATDAVGAAELQGVTKLHFAKCTLTSTEEAIVDPPGSLRQFNCNIAGVTSGDQVIATFTKPAGNPCFAITSTSMGPGVVKVVVRNVCNSSESYGDGAFFSLIVYHK